jgi:hypothetical protein
MMMGQHGDRGNVLTIVNRCRWRGIDVEVEHREIGDRVDPGQVGLLLIGGAGAHQRLVCEDLLQVKGGGIRRAIDFGVAAFAVCAGYQVAATLGTGNRLTSDSADDSPGSPPSSRRSTPGSATIVRLCASQREVLYRVRQRF